ncbi:hypothetical protein [Hydrogenophaga sp.]|uniref:hypothetical protein n=1 Tax=Hydrogenophaga sp. TaxID=1904254 RepID=UPI003564FC29
MSGAQVWAARSATVLLAAGMAGVATLVLLALVSSLGGPAWAGWVLGLVLAAFVFLLAWPMARRVGPVLIARYDAAVMRPPPSTAPGLAELSHPGVSAAWERLRAWSLEGAGPACSPFWRPGLAPRVAQKFSVAVLTGGDRADRLALVAALCRQLDGSEQLDAAGSRWAGLGLRLRVKRDDLAWWRRRRDTDPWDCGHLLPGASALQALAVFRARRATLLVAEGLPNDALARCLNVLAAHASTSHHAVRLLVVADGVAEMPEAVPVAVVVDLLACGRAGS